MSAMLLALSLSVHASPDTYGAGAGTGNSTLAGGQTLSASTPITSTATAGNQLVSAGNGSLFAIGDLVLIHQTAGASVGTNTTNPAPSYDPASLGVGHWELARVVDIVANQLTLDGPLQHSYTGTGAQVVKVEEYGTLTITGTARPSAWDGSSGGIIAIFVDGTLTVNGAIDASGRGFRGAPQDPITGWRTLCTSADDTDSGYKAEGVGGLSGFGYGNRANGGGGGSCGNGGGGGGGGAGNGGRGGRTWDGESGSGGQGHDRGGLGGAGATPDVDSYFVLGGGGGGGEANGSSQPETVGGDGGGMVFIRARTVAGSGSIRANGEDGPQTGSDDGVAGGGAGGTIGVWTENGVSCNQLEAEGGMGGSLVEGVYDEHGPGGGGGGGQIHVAAASLSCGTDVDGGDHGTYNGAEAWGSIDGDDGVVVQEGAGLVDGDNDGVLDGPDCNDGDNTVFPGQSESCNGIDDNCDGQVDEGLQTFTYYEDDDNDTFGNLNVPISACGPVAGYVSDNSDCDDTDEFVNPSADEVCGGGDEDCDTFVDEPDAIDALSWWPDTDNDGYGSGTVTTACTQPSGHADNDQDCEPGNTAVNPGATEVCNGIDDNCNSLADDDDPGVTGLLTWYFDGDDDGEGSDTAVQACAAPADYVANSDDCNDAVGTINTGATEICDNIDNDCDTLIDDADSDVDVASQSTWYLDSDDDQYGDVASSQQACTQPLDHVADATDCDDGDATTFPGAPELCDGLDNDCNPSTPDGTTQVDWYFDDDGDGYGADNTLQQDCGSPGSGWVTFGGDCNDAEDTVNPGETEVCNGVDDDCVGGIDNNAIDAELRYADLDEDGYGNAFDTVLSCDPVSGFVDNDLDCDDSTDLVSPDALEVCNDEDDDCNGVTDDDPVDALSFWIDQDGDGHGASGTVAVLACVAPSGFAPDDGDCDDDNEFVFFGAAEQCDNIDNDCDGAIDDNVVDLVWHPDEDGDGYGDPDVEVIDCVAPSGHVLDDTDCDDTEPDVNPGAVEIPDNGLDDDCDGDELVLDTGDTDEPLDTDTDTDVEIDIPEVSPRANEIEATSAKPEVEELGCQCSSASGRGGIGLLGLAVLSVLRRRGRR